MNFVDLLVANLKKLKKCYQSMFRCFGIWSDKLPIPLSFELTTGHDTKTRFLKILKSSDFYHSCVRVGGSDIWVWDDFVSKTKIKIRSFIPKTYRDQRFRFDSFLNVLLPSLFILRYFTPKLRRIPGKLHTIKNVVTIMLVHSITVTFCILGYTKLCQGGRF